MTKAPVMGDLMPRGAQSDSSQSLHSVHLSIGGHCQC